MRSANPGASLVSALLGLLVALSPLDARAQEAPKGLLSIHEADHRLDWDEAIRDLSRADVVFVGEQHGDAATHRLELALLQALHLQSGKHVVLSLEMFERDVQPVLDAYLEGRIPEEAFLEKSRPWPNYPTDYRPLVEYAKAHSLAVLASNVPRRLASRVAKEGLSALDLLSPEDRALVAREIDVPENRLWERFRETMEGHPGVDAGQVQRMYQAQCLKDATMAEGIARAAAASPKPLVLHVNGAFHSDEGLGVPAQLKRFAPELATRVTTVLPAESSEAPARGLADLVFVVTREKP